MKQRASQLVEAAVWLETTGNLEGARKLYRQALALDPNNERAQEALHRVQAQVPTPAFLHTPPELRQLTPPEIKKITEIQYPGVHDTLPEVDPELEEPATLNEVPASLQARSIEPAQELPPNHPTIPEIHAPESPVQTSIQYPESLDKPAVPPGLTRRSSKVDMPTRVEGQGRVALDLPSAPSPEPLTPPPPLPPPEYYEALPPPPPAPETAWENDGTVPGVELSALLAKESARDAMDLLSDAPPRATPPPVKKPVNVRQEVETLIKGARDKLELDDHSGAIDLIEKAAELAPDDPMVQRLRTNSEVVLQNMYESKLGRLDVRPKLLLRPDEVIWLNLDHRAGFVLAQIDGSVTYEDLFAICGMSRLDTLRILSQLVGAGVIAGAGN